jgi:aspartate/methionine/tyrosine aminotransferase
MMIKVNKHIQELQPSSTLAINQKVKELRNKGKTIYHFGFGQSPFPIHESITQALSNHVNDNNYLPTNGLGLLRDEISNFLNKHQGINFDKDDIYIGPGSKELLYQTILILEGVFLVPKGSWVSYLPQIKSKNGHYEILETQLANDFKLTAEVLEIYCNKNKQIQKTLILNSPNNPTGAIYSNQELESLASICLKHKIIVLSDEIYSQVNFNHEFSTSIAKYYPELTIVFGGLSKVFSAGGYRLGFMALPTGLHDLKRMYTSLFSETFSAVASPIQYAAITAYKYEKALQNYVNESSNVLKMVSLYVYDNLTSLGINCTKPEGAFYMMIGFENFKDKLQYIEIKTSKQLANYLLENYSVALLPSTDFYFHKGELFFRLAFVDFNGEKALGAFKNFNGNTQEFIKTHCPSIYYGTQQIIKFINDLK